MGELPGFKMVTAQIASIPNREDLLKLTVESLLLQVDQLNLMLNCYRHTPEYCYQPKIQFYHLDNKKGDAAKFYGLKKIKGYIFTCDDDLVYPPDYIETMTKKLKEYNNKVIVTCHGRIMLEKPVANSYTSRKKAFHCLKEETRETFLDIGGTGVMAWHSDFFFPDYDKITKKNMADIWVAKFSSEQNIKILHVPHREFWIKYLHPGWTVWDDAFLDPREQTELYNSF